ncbi:hypothetical protein H310_08671 [Aphanomyces invadans]|uniref:FAD-binding FR-type domain-containing protein n=1 Tax=Aphanomyces invadans TaxID=157072 RepID=A0A024TY32_9STRA|nr:hypothetical protein H310_08671 [Aphanomyces invadans]ETV98546.1 hypothetical protein H310_08671 [Aphanomyces invadans]|eukprot:XP_008872743.1 hypothetical protein H310_08671 [Aphanomyces invadans]
MGFDTSTATSCGYVLRVDRHSKRRHPQGERDERRLRRSQRTEVCLRWTASVVAVTFTLGYCFAAFIFGPLGELAYPDVSLRTLGHIHVATGAIWMLCATVQIWPSFRTRYPARHCALGYFSIGVMMVSVLAIWAMCLYGRLRLEGGLGIMASGLIFSVVWVVSIYYGVQAIKSGRVELHRHHMLRAYWLSWSIILMRPLFTVFLFALGGSPAAQDDTSRLVLGVTSWVVFALMYMAVEYWCKPQWSIEETDRTFSPCTLVARQKLTADTALVTLQSAWDDVMAFPLLAGHHCSVRVNGVTRSYTPVPGDVAVDSAISRSNQLNLMVKLVPNGKISTLLHTAPLGTLVEVLAPIVGTFRLRPHVHSELVLIAGGSGISTILSILQAAQWERRYKTIRVFVFSSTGFVWQDKLRALASETIHLTFVRERPSIEHFHNVEASGSTMVALCGSFGFMTSVLGLLKNHSRINIHAFGLDDR